MKPSRRTASVILNPASGGGVARRTRAEIEFELGRRAIDFEIVETAGPGHATELAAAAVARGAECIVAAGGDGTAHEVANGLLAAPVSNSFFAVLPIGTGNDFVKVVPGLRPRSLAYDTIASGASRRVDVGHVAWGGRGEYFINAMGTGIDVEVVRQIERHRHLPGGLVYLFALLKALSRFEPVRLRTSYDGATLENRMMMFTVGNGCCVGGAFRLTPMASPEDELLDICAVDEVPLTRILRALPRVLRGTHTSLDFVTMGSARTVDIELLDDRPLLFQLDGELRDAEGARCLRIALRAAALQVASYPAPAATDAAGPDAGGTDASSGRVRH